MSFVARWLQRNREGIIVPHFYNRRIDDIEAQEGESGASLITGMRSAWREDFPGAELNPARWTVVQTGAGQTITVTASELRIATGVTPDAETIIRSVQSFRIPLRKQVIFMLSQRIANQEFFIEMVNAAGDMLARWMYDGSDWRASVSTANANNASAARVMTGISSSLMGCQITEMLLSGVNFHQRAVDSSASGAVGIRQDRQIPDPNQEYFVQIRVRNLAVAPASTTTLTVDAISIEDATLINTEIVQGFSATSPAQSVPVNVTVGAIGTQSINLAFADTSTPLGSNAIFTGTARDFTTTQRTTRIRAASTADQAGTLFVEQSNDGTNWVLTHSAATASVTDADAVARHIANLDVPVANRFVRVRYRNGGVAQTAFRLISMQTGV